MSADTSLTRRNALFTIGVVALVPAVGSGLTIFLILSLIWNLTLLACGALRFSIPVGQRTFVFLFAQFALVGLIMSRIHDGRLFGSIGVEYIPFLAPLILLPSFVYGPERLQLRLLLLRSMAVSGMLAGALAGVETIMGADRAAAMTGNALILATVASMAGLGTLVLLLEPIGKYDRLLSVVGWGGACIAILLSQSRTLIVVYLACSTLYGILIWRLVAQKVHRAILLAGLVLTLAATAAAMAIIFERLANDPRLTAPGEPSSAEWRLVYLEAGWRVASDHLFVGVGRYDRAIQIGIELDAMNKPTSIREETRYRSWHRWLPEPFRPIVVRWQLSHWQAQLRGAEATGDGSSPPRPDIERETTIVKTSPHSHLHNAYMTMLVDHGAIGLASLVALLAGPVFMGYRAAIYRSDPALYSAYVVMVAAVSLAGLTNVHFEIDAIAAYFIVLSMLFWAAFRTPGEAKEGE